MDNTPSTQPEQRYWKSLRDLYNENGVSELKADEFMKGVTDDFTLEEMPDHSRRKFMALLSASAAFAAAACTNYRDKGEVVPYVKKPEEVVVGNPVYYASTCSGCGQSCGILVKTREGRPVKIDGNPDHPVNRGKICSKGQASVLDLYDPSRLRNPLLRGADGSFENITWEQVDEAVVKALKGSSVKTIALVSHPIVSPTGAAAVRDFLARYPNAKLYTYDLFNSETKRSAWKRSYGSGEPAIPDWSKAKLILALESDFLGTEGAVMEQVREFAANRDVMKSKNFNRLYCVEGAFSQTGTNADHRIQLRPDAQLEFVLSIINALRVTGIPVEGAVNGAVAPYSIVRIAEEYGIKKEVLETLVKDLISFKGKGLVVAGNGLPEQVHVAVNYLNEMLGNTALYTSSTETAFLQPASTAQDWEQLIGSMKRGTVSAVIHLGTDPVYHLPKTFGYADALKNVPVSVALTGTQNDTSVMCTYVLPAHHSLESWGDFQSRTGVLSLRQPALAPLYDSRQKEAALMVWTSGNTQGYAHDLYHQYLKKRWEKEVYPSANVRTTFASFWHSSLHDGVIRTTVPTNGRRNFITSAFPGATIPVSKDAYVVLATEPYFIGDGRFANNGWLQELPEPVTKIVWDNYAAMSVRTSRELGVKSNDMIEVTLPDGSVNLPVFVQPGIAPKTITIQLGYGRKEAGPIGSGVGVDIGGMIPKTSVSGVRYFANASVKKIAGTYKLVSTQEHHSLDDEFTKDIHFKRDIIREGTLAEYLDDPEFIKREREKKKPKNITPLVEYKGIKWAMAIDLNKCVGCNACVAGCNVENNIPIVGKDQVDRGREMHWMRIDRYFTGTDEDPGTSTQPMLCQHCDNAPCEKVCPVVATTHSPDGLNQMTYNRCVGTKYCSNNCPYKVRRFNFYNFRNNLADGYYDQTHFSLMHNPEVTVRSRGVMEKCTFCVQRIYEAKTAAAAEGRALKGSDVTTACQQACPAEAITFGDMNDPKSKISAYREHDLAYYVIEEWNTRPNVTYLAKLKNVHTENKA